MSPTEARQRHVTALSYAIHREMERARRRPAEAPPRARWDATATRRLVKATEAERA